MMGSVFKAWIGAVALLALCGQTLAQELTAAERVRYERVVRQTPLIDGHNDLPWEIRENYGGNVAAVDLNADTRQLATPLHTDIPRLRAGGLGAQFWSLYVPASEKGADSTAAVFEQMYLANNMIARYPQAFQLADSSADILRIHRAGRVASMFGIEGGEAINDDLALVREFRAAGVLYMTLTHAENTHWVDSATAAPEHGGLAALGETIVREMNDVGMLVDLSHVSAEAMRDVLAVAEAPVIFSHSSAFALTPHPRNVPDDVLRLVAANGGVVMVNFYPSFVSEPHRQWGARRTGEEARQKALNPGDPAAAAAGLAAWVNANPRPRVTVSDVADHIGHIRHVAGADHVGIGSDYDGIPYAPEGLEDVSAYPNLFAELMRRGWSDRDLGKLAGGNLLRALREAERVARR